MALMPCACSPRHGSVVYPSLEAILGIVREVGERLHVLLRQQEHAIVDDALQACPADKEAALHWQECKRQPGAGIAGAQLRGALDSAMRTVHEMTDEASGE